MTLKTDIDLLATDAALMHDIIHGGTSDTVTTDGGTVPSVAKAINDAVNAIESGLVANGTVSAPSIAFASDTDTGIYRIGANNIGVAANGAKVLDIATTGLAVTGALSATGNTIVPRLFAGGGNTNWPTTSIGSVPGRHILNGSNYPLLVLWNESAASAAEKSAIYLGGKTGQGATTFGGGRAVSGLLSASDFTSYLDLHACSSAGFTVTPAIRLAGRAAAAQPGVLIGTTTDDGVTALQVSGAVSISSLLTVTGGQIKFPATQNASADANTLDDYEEGTWTPTITFATPGDLSITYAVQLGGYTKKGREVTLRGNIATSAFTYTTASGILRITGIPFVDDSKIYHGSCAMRGWSSAGFTQTTVRTPGSSAVYLYVTKSGSGVTPAVFQTGEVPSGGTVEIDFTITYFV